MKFSAVIGALCAFVFWAGTAHAAAGDFDTTFNGTGVATLNSTGNTNDDGRAIAIDASGNIYLAGINSAAPGGSFMISRFLADGTLDTSFGSPNGYVTDTFSVGRGDSAFAIAVDASGRPVVAGAINTQLGKQDMGIARYQTNGSLDNTFGTAGHTEINTDAVAGANVIESANGMALDAGGKILVVGRHTQSSTTTIQIARLNSDGSLDTSFNSGGSMPGVVQTGPAGFGQAIGIDSNGKIVVAGYTSTSTTSNIVMARYNTDGTLDTSFGTAGVVNTDLGGKEQAYGLTIDSSGRIVLVGSSNVGSAAQFLVLRYNADGSTDTTFNGTGNRAVTVSSGADVAYSVAIDANDKIVVTGSAGGNTGLVRLNADGTLDTTFATGGIASVDVTMTGQQDVGYALTLDSNNRIVVGGRAFATATHYDMAVSRYDSSSAGVLQFSSATYSTGEAAGTATITVNRTSGTDGAVTVDYATSDGTATAGSDYTSTSGTLSFANGQASASFNIPITQDTLDEPDETINLALSNATGGATIGAQATAVDTIVDDDPAPALSIDNVSMAEGNSGTQNFVFTVSLDAPSGKTVSVAYATADNTATAGSDYTATSGTLTFTPGQTSATISVPVAGDTTPESDETFTVNLSSPTNATIAVGTGTGTILDDDSPGELQFASPAQSVSEGAGSITISVTRTGGSGGSVSVDYATAPGTASDGSDYVGTSGTLTWAAGDTAPKTITVPIMQDNTVEGNETFTVTLSNVTGGATIGPEDTCTVDILDDDLLATGTAVPTASPWALLALLALLALIGFRSQYRRRSQH